MEVQQVASQVGNRVESVAKAAVKRKRANPRGPRISIKRLCETALPSHQKAGGSGGVVQQKRNLVNALKIERDAAKLSAKCLNREIKKLRPKRRLPKNPDKRIAKVHKMLQEAVHYKNTFNLRRGRDPNAPTVFSSRGTTSALTRSRPTIAPGDVSAEIERRARLAI